MYTPTDRQEDFDKAFQSLIETEKGILEAYKVSIDRIENKNYQSKFREFLNTHEDHINELNKIAARYKLPQPKVSSFKNWLAKIRVIWADLIGEIVVLRTMLSNEQEIYNTCIVLKRYARGWADIASVIKRCYEDEQKHKTWIKQALKSYR